MLNRRVFLVSAVAPLAVAALDRGVLDAFQPARPPAAVPPVSWSCPMHAEVVDGQPGKCPICQMVLVPVRLALVWSCPVHTGVAAAEAGRCRQCGRDLTRVTRALTFTCRVHPKIDAIDPGACPICKRTLVPRYSIRPHGDHNPKHGGFFLMASNNWHLEVTHPAVAIFRMYIYDSYSKPFTPPGMAARVVEAPDRAGKPATVAVAFTPVPRAGYLEARLPGLAVPVDIAVKVRFEAGDDDYRCDFMFTDYSREPVVRPELRREVRKSPLV
jgi:Heavy metal binding domain